MGNSNNITTFDFPVEAPIQTTKKMFYETNITRGVITNNPNICNTMRKADRYSRNGSDRGNGVRTS